MKCYSTNNKNHHVTFADAIMKGMAEDNGLFMPEEIPLLPQNFFSTLHTLPFEEIAFQVSEKFLSDDFSASELRHMIDHALNFKIPLVKLSENLYALELFHGPTLSFKDVGTRFLAQLLSHFVSRTKQKLIILVATSGDTGGAVAHAFHKVPLITVIVLYPKGMVSAFQEKQFTTLGNNIVAIEVSGTFDDCQKLAKTAFLTPELNQKLFLSSANSINIGRLIPQTFYYFHAYAQLKNAGLPVCFSVPSGNLGNLTAGLIAKRMGLLVSKFAAPTNRNDSFPRYLEAGTFQSAATIKTISNAMDVGNPSNIQRIFDLYNHEVERIRQDIVSESFSDDQTRQAMEELQRLYGYKADPHSGIGYLGLKEVPEYQSGKTIGIFLATAHPMKTKVQVA
ncbi:MAG: threonine synthase [Candidatus Fischerbacteria bacterium RBG_13_37_8]|uniref:Threonine synthase n=1 Tax=Candidatus Fischerbacteria bacterium RBG_13_37_8 TaxID=1817863 RepID=A0A1F5VLS1_9BACT|nr:MAG: threonine synthase [Candidatus Fischerbacteria bacterium RBG_13_37_8]